MSGQTYVLPSPLRDQEVEDLSAEAIFASCRRRYSMTSEKSSAGGSARNAQVVSPSSISISSLRTSSRTSRTGPAAASSSFKFPKSTSSNPNNDSSLDRASSITSSPPASSTSGPIIGRRASSLALTQKNRNGSNSISSSESSSHYLNRYGQFISTPPSTAPSLSLSHSRTASRSDRSDVDTIASSAGFSPLGRPLRQYFPTTDLTLNKVRDDSRASILQGKRRSDNEDIDLDFPDPEESFLPSSNDAKIVTKEVKPYTRKTTISFQQRAQRNPDKVAHILGEEYHQTQRDSLQGRHDSHSTISLSSPVTTKAGIKNLFSSIRVKSKKGEVATSSDVAKSMEEKIFRFGPLAARRSELSLPAVEKSNRHTLPSKWRNHKSMTIEEDNLDDVFIISKQRNSFDAKNGHLHSLSVLDELTNDVDKFNGKEEKASMEGSHKRVQRGDSSRGERLSWLISTDDSFLQLESESRTGSYYSEDSNPSILTSRNAAKLQRPLTSSSLYSDHKPLLLKRTNSVDDLYAMLEPWAVSHEITNNTEPEIESSPPRRQALTAERKTSTRRQLAEKSLPALPEVTTADEATEEVESSAMDVSQSEFFSIAEEIDRETEMEDSMAAWCMDFNMYPSSGYSNRRLGRYLEHINAFIAEDHEEGTQLDAIPNALDSILRTLQAKLVYIARVRSKPYSCCVLEQRQLSDYIRIRPNASMHLCALAALQSGLSFDDDEDQVLQLLGLDSQQHPHTSFDTAIAVGCGLKEVGRANRGTEGWVLTVVGNTRDNLLGSENTTYLMKFASLLAPLLLAQDCQEGPTIEVARQSRRQSIPEESSPSSSVFVTPRSSPVRAGTESPNALRKNVSRRATVSSTSSHGSFSRKKLPPLASPPPTSPLPLLPQSSSLHKVQTRRPLSPPSIVTSSHPGPVRASIMQQSPI